MCIHFFSFRFSCELNRREESYIERELSYIGRIEELRQQLAAEKLSVKDRVKYVPLYTYLLSSKKRKLSSLSVS